MDGLSWYPARWVVLLVVLGTLRIFGSAALATENAITPDLSRTNDGRTWRLINAIVRTATQEGNGTVLVRPKEPATTPSNIGLAVVEGLVFANGTIEVDLKGKGKFDRSFLGIAFDVADGRNFEAVYFRPFNFMRDDAVYRARAVQYISWPDHTWEQLRKARPGVFESAVEPVPDPSDWFHARVEVTKQKVRVWVDGAKNPCLVVDRLASRAKGKVGLCVDSKEGAFRNLKIVPHE